MQLYAGEKAYYDGTNFGCELDINYKVYYGTTDDYYAKSYVITEATRQTNTIRAYQNWRKHERNQVRQQPWGRMAIPMARKH